MSLSCVDFAPAPENEEYKLNFVNSMGPECWSYTGRVEFATGNTMNLGGQECYVSL